MDVFGCLLELADLSQEKYTTLRSRLADLVELFGSSDLQVVVTVGENKAPTVEVAPMPQGTGVIGRAWEKVMEDASVGVPTDDDRWFNAYTGEVVTLEVHDGNVGTPKDERGIGEGAADGAPGGVAPA